MNDQNKLAMLGLLIVIAVAVWSKNLKDTGPLPEMAEDIFQNTQAEVNVPFARIAAKNEATRSKLTSLEKTAREPFGDDPF